VKRFTVDDVVAVGPCYSRSKIEKLFAGRKEITVADAVCMDIPIEDVLWFVGRVFTRHQTQRLIEKCKADVLLNQPGLTHDRMEWIIKAEQACDVMMCSARVAEYDEEEAEERLLLFVCETILETEET